jgi:hypothetical protein
VRIKASEIADAMWSGKTVTVVTEEGSHHVGKIRSRDKRYICISSECETMWIPVQDIRLIEHD